MTLIPVGKLDLEIMVNGSEKFSSTISSDRTESDAIQITEKFDIDITINGATNINKTISSDYSTTVYPSPDYSPTVYINGSSNGSQTFSENENINVNTSLGQFDSKEIYESYVSSGVVKYEVGGELPQSWDNTFSIGVQATDDYEFASPGIRIYDSSDNEIYDTGEDAGQTTYALNPDYNGNTKTLGAVEVYKSSGGDFEVTTNMKVWGSDASVSIS